MSQFIGKVRGGIEKTALACSNHPGGSNIVDIIVGNGRLAVADENKGQSKQEIEMKKKKDDGQTDDDGLDFFPKHDSGGCGSRTHNNY